MNRFFVWLTVSTACVFGQGQSTQWYQLTPLVARSGQTMTIRTCIVSNTVTRVTLESTVPNRPLIGTLTAQGGCYWQGTFTAPVPSIDDIFRPDFAFLRLYNGNTLVETINVFADVFTTDIPLLPVTSLAADAQRTDYVVNIVNTGVFPPDNTTLFTANPQAAARRFAELMPDVFDQLNIVFTRAFIFNRHHMLVRQPVQGIGGEVRTVADAAWGTSARLQGVNMYPIPTAFDGAERTHSHEAMHQFINHISTGLAAGPAHWPVSSMASGVMGTNGGEFNCSLRLENGSLTVRGDANDPKAFNPLDLYLMGAIPASQVPDQYVITDNAVATTLRSNCNRAPISPSQFQVLRMADLVTQLGPRVPDSAAAPKSHRIATVLVSDRLLNQEEMSFYSFFARRAEERGAMKVKVGFAPAIINHPMWSASGGKFSVTTRLTDAVLPVIDYGGVVSVAFTETTSPGGIVSIFGSNFSAGTSTADRYPLPPVLQGTRVFVNGVVAPLYYVSPTQINFQMPTTVVPSAGNVVTVRVETAAGPSNTAYVPARAVAPAVLFYGDRKTVAVDLAYQVITAANPARHGQFVVVYFTGAGPTNPAVATGAAAPSAAPALCSANLAAEIGGVLVTPAFCGLAPGFGGLGQMNFVIPESAGTGEKSFRIIGPNGPSNETFMSVAP